MEYIALWAMFGVAAAIVGSNRGGSGGNWFLVGLLLGPIGLVLAFTAGVQCPHCRSKINPKAETCPKCQRDLGRLDGEPKDRQKAQEKGVPLVANEAKQMPALFWVMVGAFEIVGVFLVVLGHALAE